VRARRLRIQSRSLVGQVFCKRVNSESLTLLSLALLESDEQAGEMQPLTRDRAAAPEAVAGTPRARGAAAQIPHQQHYAALHLS